MSGCFEKAVAIVLEKEGVLSDDARDPGGLTKYGISKKAYPDLDIANLTVDDAIAIYRRDYWAKIRGDDLAWAFALPLFDCAVNQGSGAAIRFFQLALGVRADGAFGPATLAAAQSHQAKPDDVLVKFMAQRILHYASLGTWPTFGRGWARRAFAIALLATK
jgi:lysozyme family protein